MTTARPPAASIDSSRFWWREDDPHQSIVATIRWLDSQQRHHRLRNYRNLRLYGNVTMLGFGGGAMFSPLPLPSERLTLNVVQSVVDAATSQIATNKPRIFNLTEGGNWSQKQRAKRLDKWNQGIFYETGAYDLGRDAFRDCGVFGTGTCKVIENEGRAALERAFVDDLIVDDRDARRGKPRQIFEVRDVSREQLIEFYPKFADQIRSASPQIRDDDHFVADVTMGDIVQVAESFHLPSSSTAKDGRHALVIDNATLMVEEWKFPYFPYPALRWGKMPLGFWGFGIADQLVGVQIEINYLLQKIQRLMTLATTQVWIQKGSVVAKNKMTNEDFAVMEFVGQPPIHTPIQSVSPEYFQHCDRLYNRAYEIAGVNQLTAQAQKPAGLDSGKALDAYQDTQSRRFMEIGQRYDEFFLQVADMLADKTSEIAERDGEYKVKARDKNYYEMMDWKDVRMDRDQYISQPYPTNFFPQTPSGKWKQVDEMMQRNFLTREEAADLLDYPDLESVTRLRNAPIEYVQKVIESIVEHGKQPDVDSYTPQALVMQMFPLEILRAQMDRLPEDRIEMLRSYLDETQAMANATMPPAPTQELAPPASALPPEVMTQ